MTINRGGARGDRGGMGSRGGFRGDSRGGRGGRDVPSFDPPETSFNVEGGDEHADSNIQQNEEY